MPTRRADLSIPYQEHPHMPGAKWYVQETLYPESRGYNTYEFTSQSEANKFIEGTPL